LVAALLCGATLLTTSHARGDAVTEWSAYLDEAAMATAQPVPAQSRSAAIVHVAIFDAVNGIVRQFTPYHVTERAPHGARPEAAAMQAAYTTICALYPAHKDALDLHLAESIRKLPGGNGNNSSNIRGRAWGEYVAQRILTLRSTDGWSDPQPPFMGGFETGQWRSVPFGANADGALPAVFPQNAVLAPFAMSAPSQFRPGPPYGAATLTEALRTSAYAQDLEEVQEVGRVDSTSRTAEQTDIARLWQMMGCIDENRAARSVVSPKARLVDNARLFALMNMAACDALIVGWDSKFTYELWRPHHAIRLADTDDNAATTADPTWSGLILAPRFPEYVSNHATLTGAIMRVLERELGNEHSFTLGSPQMPGFTQHFERFSDATTQAKEARIWGGIHFRHACELGEQLGVALADFVVENYLRPVTRTRY
jgi:hypothetical protein